MKKLMMIIGSPSKVDRKILEDVSGKEFTPNQFSDFCCLHKLSYEEIGDFCTNVNDEFLSVDEKWISYCFVNF